MAQTNGNANGEVSGAGWEDLAAALEQNKAVTKLNDLFKSDGQFLVSRPSRPE